MIDSINNIHIIINNNTCAIYKYLSLHSESDMIRMLMVLIKVLCEQTRKLTHDFLGLCLMLSGLGNFVVDCHIWSTSSSSVFANVAKKQSNVGIRRHYN